MSASFCWLQLVCFLSINNWYADDMKMIFTSSCCLQISGGCPINKSSHPNLTLSRARSQWRCLAFSKTTILDTQAICQIKHHKEAFQSSRGGKLSFSLSCKVLETWHASLSRAVLAADWQTCEISRGCTGAQRSVYACDPLSFFSYEQLVCVLKEECSHIKVKKEAPRLSVCVLWGYHTCRMCCIKHDPLKKSSHIQSGFVGVKSRKA